MVLGLNMYEEYKIMLKDNLSLYKKPLLNFETDILDKNEFYSFSPSLKKKSYKSYLTYEIYEVPFFFNDLDYRFHAIISNYVKDSSINRLLMLCDVGTKVRY
jgi:hypothetical protein